MKFDLKKEADEDRLNEFRTWLQNETTSSLSRARGNRESIRAAVFLFMNRALEAHLPEAMIGELLGISAVRSGLAEDEQEFAFGEADVALGTFGQMYEKT